MHINEFLGLSVDAGSNPDGPEYRKNVIDAIKIWLEFLEEYEDLGIDSAKILTKLIKDSPLPALDKQSVLNKINAKVKLGVCSRKKHDSLENRGGSQFSQEFKWMHRYLHTSDWEEIKSGDTENGIAVMVNKCMQVKCHFPNQLSMVHFISVLQLARNPSAHLLADTADGYHMLQKLKIMLRKVRPSGSKGLLKNYPAEPQELQTLKPDVYEALFSPGIVPRSLMGATIIFSQKFHEFTEILRVHRNPTRSQKSCEFTDILLIVYIYLYILHMPHIYIYIPYIYTI